jgi:hypothetical protein
MRARFWTYLIALVPAMLLGAGAFYCWLMLQSP